MMKLMVVVALAGAACGGDDGGGGGGGDTLPKQGDSDSDPTIVSAVADCSCGPICISGADPNRYIRVTIVGSDPAGVDNLGSCAATIENVTDQGTFGAESAATECDVFVDSPCTPGATYGVSLTVSNNTAGVTTASVSLPTGA